MNKIKFTLLFLFLSIIIFNSCQIEPFELPKEEQPNVGVTTGGNSGPTSATGIIGTYKLTAYNTSVPTDLNNNGVTSVNQMTETDCFNGNTLILSDNKAFTATQKGIKITLNGTTPILNCYTNFSNIGVYNYTGDTLTLIYTLNGVIQNEVYTSVGNTLKRTISKGKIVSVNGGIPTEITADIEIIYTKQ